MTYTVAAGRYSALSQADANAEAYSVACLQATQHLLCLSDPTSPCCVDAAYGTTITGTSAFRGAGDLWQFVSGTIPTGLTLTTGYVTSATLAGTPTVPGVYTFTLRLTLASTGDSVTKLFTIRVVGITSTSPLTDANIGVAYSNTLTQFGGVGYVWVLVAGALPAGLSLNAATGEISGTPTTAGTAAFTIGLFTA